MRSAARGSALVHFGLSAPPPSQRVKSWLARPRRLCDVRFGVVVDARNGPCAWQCELCQECVDQSSDANLIRLYVEPDVARSPGPRLTVAETD